MFTKDIHYSQDLETAILGACLFEKTAFGRVYGILNPDVFYFDAHKTIFRLIGGMWDENTPIDIITVTLAYCKAYGVEIDGTSSAYFITKLINSVCSTANLEYHSLLLRQMYMEREAISITNSGIDGKKDVIQNLDDLQEKLQKLRQINVHDDFRTMDEVLVDMYSHMDNVKDKELIGITTGFKNLDRITGGFEPGGMYVIAARPSVGKSAIMGKMAIAAAKKGKQVGIITLEMKDMKVGIRLSSLVTDVEFWRIDKNRMQDQQQTDDFYYSINANLSSLPIRISDAASVNIGDIKAKVARLKQRGEVDILFIDYLGLIDTGGMNRNYNRENEVSKISRGLKLMAMQYDIPLIVLCQLNRMSESTHDKKPKLHHLRESGSIEQDADGVMFLHRDFSSGIKQNQDGGSTEREADIIIAKWRNGEVCEYKIGFDAQRMKFFEFDEVGVYNDTNL